LVRGANAAIWENGSLRPDSNRRPAAYMEYEHPCSHGIHRGRRCLNRAHRCRWWPPLLSPLLSAIPSTYGVDMPLSRVVLASGRQVEFLELRLVSTHGDMLEGYPCKLINDRKIRSPSASRRTYLPGHAGPSTFHPPGSTRTTTSARSAPRGAARCGLHRRLPFHSSRVRPPR
jgi:hypothetical protein